MTRKVHKANKRVLYRSTVRSLNPDELADETMKLKQKEFTEKVNSAVGDGLKYKDFVNNPELEHLGTLICQAYADDDDDGKVHQMVEADNEPPEPDADTHDQYVGASVRQPPDRKRTC